MKPLFLTLFTCVMSVTLLSGTSLMERGYEKNAATDWGEWMNDGCFKGIDYRVKKGDYNSYAGKWYWYMQIRNRYQEDINISYVISEPGQIIDPDHRTPVRGGSISESKVALLYNADRCHVRVGYLRFGNNDSGPYYSCDQ